jgi:hypothetical protein
MVTITQIMKKFLIKLGIFTTLFYSFLFYSSFTDAFTDDGKKVMPVVFLMAYIVSMIYILHHYKKEK